VLEQTYGAPMDVLEHAGMPLVVDHYEPSNDVVAGGRVKPPNVVPLPHRDAAS
jgi:hypothetical protein